MLPNFVDFYLDTFLLSNLFDFMVAEDNVVCNLKLLLLLSLEVFFVSISIFYRIWAF